MNKMNTCKHSYLEAHHFVGAKANPAACWFTAFAPVPLLLKLLWVARTAATHDIIIASLIGRWDGVDTDRCSSVCRCVERTFSNDVLHDGGSRILFGMHRTTVFLIVNALRKSFWYVANHSDFTFWYGKFRKHGKIAITGWNFCTSCWIDTTYKIKSRMYWSCMYSS